MPVTAGSLLAYAAILGTITSDDVFEWLCHGFFGSVIPPSTIEGIYEFGAE